MAQLFGDFSAELPQSEEFLTLGFSPGALPMKQRWRNNGLSADFIAGYLANFFPSIGNNKIENKQIEIQSAVSYIANELLENAMKFSDETTHHPVVIQLLLYVDKVVFYVTNSVPPKKVDAFQALIQQLMQSNPQELYIKQLEYNAVAGHCTDSRLGLLTILSDYMAKMGWKFEQITLDPPTVIVTTMVELPI